MSSFSLRAYEAGFVGSNPCTVHIKSFVKQCNGKSRPQKLLGALSLVLSTPPSEYATLYYQENCTSFCSVVKFVSQ